MIAIHQNKVKVVQANFLSEIQGQRIKALKKLKELSITITNVDDKRYLESVISLFEKNNDILLWDPEKIEIEKKVFLSVPTFYKKYKNGKTKAFKTEIKNKILKALGYSNLRSSFYPKYFNEIGFKACVYCNSQLTITANKKPDGEYSAKFDVDHYNSKDDYPFLSISLFNLYPACSSCNRAKSNNKVEFELYTNDRAKTLKSDYNFKLNPYSKVKYLTTKDSKVIEITFEEPKYSVGANTKTFKEVFHIEGIYKTQDDLIEELIIKSQIYNQAYLKTLKSNFSKLALHPELFKRTLIGNYTEDKDLHKRPMSKLVMDIAKDLGLI